MARCGESMNWLQTFSAREFNTAALIIEHSTLPQDPDEGVVEKLVGDVDGAEDEDEEDNVPVGAMRQGRVSPPSISSPIVWIRWFPSRALCSW